MKQSLTDKMMARLARSDYQTLQWLRSHTNILAAIATLLICVWASAAGLMWLIPAVIVIGAVSYFWGITIAFTCIAVILVYSAATASTFSIAATRVMGEVAGLFCVTWLGFQHKAETLLERTQTEGHADQVVPWHVVNDVRTSLAAIRFLLFPMHNERHDRELTEATQELSRLEHLFTQIEQERHEKNKS